MASNGVGPVLKGPLLLAAAADGKRIEAQPHIRTSDWWKSTASERAMELQLLLLKKNVMPLKKKK